jgi:methanogenic corrinoid protein MtbC1
MLDDLTPQEVVAIVHLMHNVQEGQAVFVGDTLHMLESVPGMQSLAEKVNEAGLREDVQQYMARTYREDDDDDTATT